ncbi:hypothetical protein BGZ93_007499 [Podila epicladia]|nr:hypothetical protein BGZ92_009504 [Podila epicladia]KAG0094193.1 hypothetical protein BGZ93_007499 [Podila epicladia]
MSNRPPSSKHLDEYNVLVLGETQSGKSTLIQYMRKYANPDVEINTKAIGTGFLSHTLDVSTTSISTDLPEYYVTHKEGAKDAKINYGEFITASDEYDYEDCINSRKNLETKRGDARLPKNVKFNLIDTPGLNATAGDDESHIQKIFHALNEAKTIHLLLISISSGPFTPGLRDAIKAYADLFPGFDGIIAFVHTHFDYKNRHPACAQISHAIDMRTESLRGIMGRTSFPQFKIDCDVYSKRPIRECITLNTIRKILDLATFNRPVDMLHTVVNKTRKMRDIDNFLRDKFQTAIANLKQKNCKEYPREGTRLADLLSCESYIHDLEWKIRALDEFFVRYDAALPEVLHEERRDMEYEVIGLDQIVTVCYQERGVLGIPISGRDLLCHEFQVVHEIGRGRDGGPWRSWQADFQPMSSPHHSLVHVKIYTTRCEKYRDVIEQKLREHRKLLFKRDKAIRCRDQIEHQRERWPQQIRNLVDEHAEKLQALGFLANEFLMPEVFKALMDAEAYIGDMTQCLKKVEKRVPRQLVVIERRPVDAGQNCHMCFAAV